MEDLADRCEDLMPSALPRRMAFAVELRWRGTRGTFPVSKEEGKETAGHTVVKQVCDSGIEAEHTKDKLLPHTGGSSGTPKS